MGKINESSRIVFSATQLSTESDDEAVILDTKNKLYFGLEGVGARVWSLIAQELTVGEIVEVILNEFDVDRGNCLQDCLEFLAKLHQKQLIEICDD